MVYVLAPMHLAKNHAMLSVLDFVVPLIGSDSFFVGTATHPLHGPVLDYRRFWLLSICTYSNNSTDLCAY